MVLLDFDLEICDVVSIIDSSGTPKRGVVRTVSPQLTIFTNETGEEVARKFPEQIKIANGSELTITFDKPSKVVCNNGFAVGNRFQYLDGFYDGIHRMTYYSALSQDDLNKFISLNSGGKPIFIFETVALTNHGLIAVPLYPIPSQDVVYFPTRLFFKLKNLFDRELLTIDMKREQQIAGLIPGDIVKIGTFPRPVRVRTVTVDRTARGKSLFTFGDCPIAVSTDNIVEFDDRPFVTPQTQRVHFPNGQTFKSLCFTRDGQQVFGLYFKENIIYTSVMDHTIMAPAMKRKPKRLRPTEKIQERNVVRRLT